MSDRSKKSKKPSGTRAERLLEESTFFTDECLARFVPEKLSEAGWKVAPHHEYFAKGTEDVAWPPIVGRSGWVVLTKDKAIRHKPWEMAKVIEAGVHLFTLPHGSMNAGGMAAAFIANGRRMGRVLHKVRAPFVAVVTKAEVIVVVQG